MRVASVTVACASCVGRVRERNEDIAVIDGVLVRDDSRSMVIPIGNDTHFFAVADGVGGAPCGHIASKIVAAALSRSLLSIPRALARAKGGVVRYIKTCGAEANADLIEHARQNPRTRGMATTLAGVFVHQGVWYVVNCGDTRVYHWSGGGAWGRMAGVAQLTRDHTLREFSGDPRVPGNIICNCFGDEADFFVDAAPISCAPDAVLLICSDGLSDMVDDAQIAAAITAHARPAEAAAALQALADRAGAPDNVTAVVIACR